MCSQLWHYQKRNWFKATFYIPPTPRVMKASMLKVIFIQPFVTSEQMMIECSCILHRSDDTFRSATKLSVFLSLPYMIFKILCECGIPIETQRNCFPILLTGTRGWKHKLSFNALIGSL